MLNGDGRNRDPECHQRTPPKSCCPAVATAYVDKRQVTPDDDERCANSTGSATRVIPVQPVRAQDCLCSKHGNQQRSEVAEREPHKTDTAKSWGGGRRRRLVHGLSGEDDLMLPNAI